MKQADKIFVMWTLKFSDEVQVISSRESRSMSSFRNVQYTSRTEERRGFPNAVLTRSPSQVFLVLASIPGPPCPSQGFGNGGLVQSALSCLRISPDAPNVLVGSQHFIHFASLFHIVPSKSLESSFGTNTEEGFGARRVSLCQGPPDPGSATVFRALFSHGGHATGPGRHWSCGQGGTWNSAQRDQRNFSNEALLYWKQSSRLFQLCHASKLRSQRTCSNASITKKPIFPSTMPEERQDYLFSLHRTALW